MGFGEKSYPVKGFIVGLVLSIIFCLFAFITVIFDGGFFNSPDPIGEKIFGFFTGMIVSLLITSPFWIIILIICTLIGFIIGKLKSKKQINKKSVKK